jgi:hypothetical protein
MAAPKWTKTYKIVTPTPTTTTMQDSQDMSGGTLYNSHSWYQRLVQGSSTRMTRYREYDGMDNDVDINRALDTIAEEMTQKNRKTDLHIDLKFHELDGRVSNTHAATLMSAMRYWSVTHEFDSTLFNVARGMVKYGDCFFRKTNGPLKKWEFIHAKNVIAAVVDEMDVTNIVAWQIRKETNKAQANIGGIGVGGQQYESEFVPAEEIVRFTLNDDMSETAPFGESILKPVYRSFKQKELLEDAVLIYRISRAPERRVFYIDVGKMPPQRTKQYLEQIKNEIKQKKIPSQNGNGENQVESVYNPHSTQEDFFFAQRADGKGSRVETLPGGNSLGEMSDVNYFQDRVWRGLRIPTSYMQTSTGNESNPIFNDGRVGQAYIEELRFAEFCMRLQRNMERALDKEFKVYLRKLNIQIDPQLFSLTLPEPTNFGLYKQQEADAAILGTLAQADGIPFLDKRFALARFGQFEEEEILRNERQMCETLGIGYDDPERFRKIYGAPEEAADEFGGLGDLGGGDLGGEMSADDTELSGGLEGIGDEAPE